MGGGAGLQFRVLGPLQVVRDDVDVVVPRRRERLVLARLLVDVGELVPAPRLMDEIWGPTTPVTGTGPLRTNVWELRRTLRSAPAGNGEAASTDEVIVSRSGGYALVVGRGQVDSACFEDLLAGAGAAVDDPERGLAQVEAALRLWRGPAFGDLAGERALQVESARLDQLRLTAQELRARLLLDLGRHEQVAVELGAVARANPERERLWASLMTALYRCGRQGDALRCYQEARSRLVEAIGVEPGPELRRLEQAILRHDAALDRPPPVAAGRGPPRAPGNRRHNLPRPLTGLVGRATERAAAAEALDRSRLVSLVGPGGCGKTRLAIAVAGDVLGRFPGGVWFVDLAGVSGMGPATAVVAAVRGRESGVAGPGGPTPWAALLEDDVLLLLDNCEHVVDLVADYVGQVLDAAPRLRVLATSREELCLPGETVCRIGGLSLPSDADQRPFMGSEAVELFVTRGAATLAHFAPSPEALGLVARVCRRLDGLPLAIELAAPLVGTLPVAEIARRVEERCSLAFDAPRRGPPRHRTLGAALEWSFDLLDRPAQELFVHLGVFAGSFTLDAVETVVGPTIESQPVVRALGTLVRASLLERVAGHDGVERYRMLQTVREHAVDRLRRRSDAVRLRGAHASAVAAFATEADRGMRGPRSAAWRVQVEAELPNVRAALRWAIANDQVDVALRIVSSLRWFLSRLASPDELSRWLGACMDRKAEVGPDLRLGLLATSSIVAVMRGDREGAGRLGQEAVAAARTLHDDHQLAVVLVAAAAAAWASDDLRSSWEHAHEAHRVCERVGDRWGLGWVLVGKANLAQATGNTGEARRRMRQALDIFKALGDLHSQVIPLEFLALLALDAGESQAAVDLASEALRTVTVADYDEARHVASSVLGIVELGAGRLLESGRLFAAGLRQLRSDQDDPFVPFDLEGLAVVATNAADFEAAARLFGLAEHIRRSRPYWALPKWDAAVSSVIDLVRWRLGPERAARLLQRGGDMTIDDALAMGEAATAVLAALATRTR